MDAHQTASLHATRLQRSGDAPKIEGGVDLFAGIATWFGSEDEDTGVHERRSRNGDELCELGGESSSARPTLSLSAAPLTALAQIVVHRKRSSTSTRSIRATGSSRFSWKFEFKFPHFVGTRIRGEAQNRKRPGIRGES